MSKGIGYLVACGKNYQLGILEIQKAVPGTYHAKQEIGLHDYRSFAIQGPYTYIKKKLFELKDYRVIANGSDSIKIVIKDIADEIKPSQAVIQGLTSIISCQGAVIGVDQLSSAAGVVTDGILTAASMISDEDCKRKKLLKTNSATILQKMGHFANTALNREVVYRVEFTLHVPLNQLDSGNAYDTGTNALKVSDCLQAIQTTEARISKPKKNPLDKLLEHIKSIDKEIAFYRYKPRYSIRPELHMQVKKLTERKEKIIKRNPALKLILLRKKLYSMEQRKEQLNAIIKKKEQTVTTIEDNYNQVTAGLSESVVPDEIEKFTLEQVSYLEQLTKLGVDLGRLYNKRSTLDEDIDETTRNITETEQMIRDENNSPSMLNCILSRLKNTAVSDTEDACNNNLSLHQ